jgi:hypothetical protein
MVCGAKSGSVIFEGILMMLESYSPGSRKKRASENRNSDVTFPHSDLGPDFLPRNSKLKYINTVNSILSLCKPLYLIDGEDHSED